MPPRPSGVRGRIANVRSTAHPLGDVPEGGGRPHDPVTVFTFVHVSATLGRGRLNAMSMAVSHPPNREK